ncbi:hypothetical protein BO99DRAFT_102626 [Aspergillus violaceofuscus CBS 115571]|uniref:Uncharacterized protein n=1 Tax=Aspergillus violaceofuscus (strain CBS 115571) TaxID=1450538 RepID=A0A2V5H915_ASPV1|nr:hypothetical protein BO99DRAFT_102626 [Aspergillus violaceofuscus CBS 115571]
MLELGRCKNHLNYTCCKMVSKLILVVVATVNGRCMRAECRGQKCGGGGHPQQLQFQFHHRSVSPPPSTLFDCFQHWNYYASPSRNLL